MRERFTNKAMRATVPSPALRVAYRKKLMQIVDGIQNDLQNELMTLYKREAAAIALDETPVEKISRMINGVSKKWQADQERRALELSRWFVGKILAHVTRAQKSAAQSSGLPDIGVAFSLGIVSEDETQALVQENVALIKSIESQYFDRITGSVMRSVTAGRDLQGLAKDLYKDYDITARRAAFIARDQNDKATNQISRMNARAAGVTQGIWQHVPGRKSSRESHVRMNGKKFELNKGMYDPEVDKYIFPGELPGCRCRFKPIFEFKP